MDGRITFDGIRFAIADSSVIDDGGSYLDGCADYVFSTEGDTEAFLGTNDNTPKAQNFKTPPLGRAIETIKLKLYKTGTPDGNLLCGIYQTVSASDSTPSSTVVGGDASVSVSLVTGTSVATATWVTFDIANIADATLTADREYSIILKRSGGTIGDIGWVEDTDGATRLKWLSYNDTDLTAGITWSNASPLNRRRLFILNQGASAPTFRMMSISHNYSGRRARLNLNNVLNKTGDTPQVAGSHSRRYNIDAILLGSTSLSDTLITLFNRIDTLVTTGTSAYLTVESSTLGSLLVENQLFFLESWEIPSQKVGAVMTVYNLSLSFVEDDA